MVRSDGELLGNFHTCASSDDRGYAARMFAQDCNRSNFQRVKEIGRRGRSPAGTDQDLQSRTPQLRLGEVDDRGRRSSTAVAARPPRLPPAWALARDPADV